MAGSWFDNGRCALLLMDYQVDACASGGRMVEQRPEVLERYGLAVSRAGVLLAAARDTGRPVLHVRHAFSPGYPELAAAPPTAGMARIVRSAGAFVDGEPGAEIVEPLRPAAGEVVLRKTTLSPFQSTELSTRLQALGVDTLILGGVVTHYVVLAAAFDAVDRGFGVVVASDACAAGDPRRHSAALDVLGPIAAVSNVEALTAQLRGLAPGAG